MKITKETKDNHVILNISGYMTADNIRPVKQIFEACLEIKPDMIILNMEDVKMIDGSGIGAIAFVVKRLRPAGELKITGAHGHVAKILRMVRLDKAIDVYPFCSNQMATDKFSGNIKNDHSEKTYKPDNYRDRIIWY